MVKKEGARIRRGGKANIKNSKQPGMRGQEKTKYDDDFMGLKLESTQTTGILGCPPFVIGSFSSRSSRREQHMAAQLSKLLGLKT